MQFPEFPINKAAQILRGFGIDTAAEARQQAAQKAKAKARQSATSGDPFEKALGPLDLEKGGPGSGPRSRAVGLITGGKVKQTEEEGHEFYDEPNYTEETKKKLSRFGSDHKKKLIEAKIGVREKKKEE